MNILQPNKVLLDKIAEIDAKTKPNRFDLDVALLTALYEDSSIARQATQSYLDQLGIGLKSAYQYPIQHGILQYIIERLAGRYDSPPTRQLLLKDRFLDEVAEDHRIMEQLVEETNLDTVLAAADRYSHLLNTVFLRVYYPEIGKMSIRMFTPSNVMRVPSNQLADDIEYDRYIVLKLTNDEFEVHVRNEDGTRQMFLINKKGDLLAEQPFGPEGFYPEDYNLLPIVRFDAVPTIGQPWAGIRLSRINYTLAMSGLQSEVQALQAVQSHARLIYKTTDQNRKPPDMTSPSTVAKIPLDDELLFEHPDPAIQESLEVLKAMTENFLLGEKIPTNEASGQMPNTGLALKIQERSLRQGKKNTIKLAQKAEKEIWRVLRMFYNAEATTNVLNTETEMVATITNLDQPEDDRTILENGARAMALGILGPVQLAQQLLNCRRLEAIRHIEQGIVDRMMYPTPLAQEAMAFNENAEAPTAIEGQVGESSASQADVLANASGQPSADSNTQAAQGISAAQARAERRRRRQERVGRPAPQQQTEQPTVAGQATSIFVPPF